MVSSWYGGTRVTSGVPTYPLSTLQYFSKASNTLRHHARHSALPWVQLVKTWAVTCRNLSMLRPCGWEASAHTARRCSH